MQKNTLLNCIMVCNYLIIEVILCNIVDKRWPVLTHYTGQMMCFHILMSMLCVQVNKVSLKSDVFIVGLYIFDYSNSFLNFFFNYVQITS